MLLYTDKRFIAFRLLKPGIAESFTFVLFPCIFDQLYIILSVGNALIANLYIKGRFL